MAIQILHLTHKDVRSDTRIVREVTAIANAWGERAKISCFGIGAADSETSLPDNVGIYNFSSRLLIFLFFLKALRLKPSFIHCHGVVVLPIGVLLKIFIKDAKLIYDTREIASDCSYVIRPLIRFIERKAWRYIDLFIGASFSMMRWYQQEYGYGAQTALVMNSPPLIESPEESETLRQKLGIADGAHVFVYRGDLTKERSAGLSTGQNIGLILDVFTSKISHPIVFIGKGELEQKITEIAKTHPNIYHLPSLADIGGANTGLCLMENTSLNSSLGLPSEVFDYAFAGLSVIGSNVAEISRLIKRYKLGIITDLTSEALAKACTQITQEKFNKNPKTLRALAWEKQAANLILGYNQIKIKDD